VDALRSWPKDGSVPVLLNYISGVIRTARRGVGRGREAAWMVGAWLAGAAVFYREQWTDGFKKLQGNDGDTRLEAYLCEHWFRVLHGQDAWQNLTFFYPVKDLLGWSDGFVLYQIFYAPLRLLGCDPFVALQVTVILLSLVGFVSFVVLVRAAFGAGRIVAGIGGMIFVFANALYLHAGAQLDAIYIVPLILLLGLKSWRTASTQPTRSAVFGTAFGLLWALLFFTSYYPAYLSTLAASIAVVVLFLTGPRWFAARAIAALRTAWQSAALAVIGFGIGIIPFLITYLPARHNGAGTSYAVALAYAGKVHDLIDVGDGNIFWSGLIHRLEPSANLTAFEATYAVTPLVMLIALVGGGFAAWRLITHAAARPAAARAATVLVLAMIVFAVLPLDTRFGSLWAIVYHLPGANAMRAIFRLEAVTGLLATLVIVAASTEIAAWLATLPRATYFRIAGVALLLLGLVEQFNTTPVSYISDPAQTALLRRVTPAPPACRSFYVTDRADESLAFFEYQIDAMLISQKLSLPTINGYTGYNPTGWGLEHIGASDYQGNVTAWAVGKGVSSGLCELDLGTMTWDQNPLVAVTSERG